MPRVGLEMKLCKKCETEKPSSEFHKDKSKKDGLRFECKECRKEYDKKYNQINKERIYKYKKEWRNKNPIRGWCQATIRYHKSDGFNVLFTFKDLLPIAKETTYCPICGVKLEWRYGTGYQPNTPSLDRKDNENTLNLNNVWIVCRKCNATKQDRSIKEFIDYCELVYKKFGGDF